MIRPTQRSGVTVLLAVLVLGFSLAVRAAQFTVDQLMGALASNRHGAATFTEKKYISILDQAVESSGELLFIPPARLEKRTISPKAETLVLDGDVLTVERQTQTHVLQLKDYPEVSGMVESIRATLAGDRKALERVYHVDLEGSRNRWALVLTPLDARVGSVIASIRVEGSRDEVHTVEIFQADGDRSVMSVQKGGSP
jgi:outer membrane lipoprotein-sorting protein